MKEFSDSEKQCKAAAKIIRRTLTKARCGFWSVGAVDDYNCIMVTVFKPRISNRFFRRLKGIKPHIEKRLKIAEKATNSQIPFKWRLLI